MSFTTSARPEKLGVEKLRAPLSNGHLLTIRSLGALAAFSNNQPIEVTPKTALVLLYLVANRRRGVTRSELIGVFWSSFDERSARHSLSQALHAIRVGAPSLKVVAWRDELRIDTDAQWDYEEAIGSLTCGDTLQVIREIPGQFLQGVFVDSSNAFEDWRTTYQITLEAHIRSCFARAIDVAIVRSEWRKLGEVFHKLTNDFGFDLETLISDERIRDQMATSLRIHSASAPSNSIQHARSTPPLVGRASEIRRVLDAYEQSKTGRLLHVNVSGEAGIGKSRFVNAILDALSSRNVHTIRVRCFETNASSGLTAVLEGLRNSGQISLVNRLSEPWKGVMRAMLAEQEPQVPMSGDERQQFVMEALARLLETMSNDAPVVMFIDDMQWSGASIVEFLSHLKRGRLSLKLLLVTATRVVNDQEAQGQATSDRSSEIRLNYLSVDDVQAFVQQLSLHPSSVSTVARELHNRTAGHPYLMSEVARSIQNLHNNVWSPATIRLAFRDSVPDYLTDRLLSLKPSARHLLNVIVILGKPTPFQIVKCASYLPMPLFLSALQELMDRNLITDCNGMLESKHDLVRQTIYELLGKSQRRILHRRAAITLTSMQVQPFDAVRHYVSAGMRRRAYLSAMRAARISERLGADDDVETYLLQASTACRSVGKRTAITWRRARFWFDRNQVARAADIYESLIINPNLPANRRAYANSCILEAALFRGALSTDELRSRLMIQIERTRQRSTIESHVRALRTLARLEIQTGNLAATEQLCQTLRHVANDFPATRPAVEALRWEALLYAVRGQTDEADKALTRAMLWAEVLRDKRAMTEIAHARVTVNVSRGDLRAAMAIGQSVLKMCEEHGLFRQRSIMLGNMSTIALDMADYDYAEALLHEVTKTVRSHENFADLGRLNANYAILNFERGDYSSADLHAQKSFDASLKVADYHVVTSMRAIIGFVALKEGRMTEARNQFEQIVNGPKTTRVDDIVVIEQFVSRMLEREGRIVDAIHRIDSILADDRLGLNACCVKGLELELARLLAKRDLIRAESLATAVSYWAKQRGAVSLARQADETIVRIENSRSLAMNHALQ